ncbi:AAA family ATPase [Rhodococcus hoagii]|nr:AAA family ATPase [Prescottella equi]
MARDRALQVLGGEQGLSDMVRTSTHSPSRSAPRTAVTERWIQQPPRRSSTPFPSTSRVAGAHLIAEAQRVVRAANLPADRIQPVVDRLVSATKSPEMSVALGREDDLNEPDVLRRRDGSSVYSTAGTQLYTSESVLAAEQRIVDAALRTDGRRTSEMDVDLALLEQAANDFELNADRPRSCGRWPPPAPGYSWRSRPPAPARRVRWPPMPGHGEQWRQRYRPRADRRRRGRTAQGSGRDHGHDGQLIHTLKEQPFRTPECFDQIGPDTVVVVDEAGMASTADLDRVIDFVLERGGSVRLVGDDQQLASVSAGGVLRDVASSAGAVTLTDGAVQGPRRGSRVDRLARGRPGRDRLLRRPGPDPRRRQGRSRGTRLPGMAERPRRGSRRRHAGPDPGHGPRPQRARAYDRPTRPQRGRHRSRNDAVGRTHLFGRRHHLPRPEHRRLALTRTDFVRNGDRWTVDEVHQDGSLTVTHIGTARSIHLPADYVAENTTLGYARTIHGAQGITADTCHNRRHRCREPPTRLRRTDPRQARQRRLLRYRERRRPRNVIDRETLLPPTAVDIFTDILARDGAQKSATTTARALDDPAQRIAHAAAAYDDAVGTAAEHTIGAEELARIDAAAEDVWKGLTDQAAYPVLQHLAIIAVGGDDAVEMLRAQQRRAASSTAADIAAVLDWRLDPSGEHSAGTARCRGCRLSRPRSLPTRSGGRTCVAAPTWSLTSRTRSRGRPRRSPSTPRPVGAAAARRRPPTGQGSCGLAGSVRCRRGGPPSDRTGTLRRGAEAPPASSRQARDRGSRAAECRRVALAFPRGVGGARLLEDPFWPELADRLALTRRSGVDVHALVRRAVRTGRCRSRCPPRHCGGDCPAS